jgi:hypothetical protein
MQSFRDREKRIDNLPTHLKHTLWLLGTWLVYVYLVKLAKLQHYNLNTLSSF